MHSEGRKKWKTLRKQLSLSNSGFAAAEVTSMHSSKIRTVDRIPGLPVDPIDAGLPIEGCLPIEGVFLPHAIVGR